MVWCPDSGVRVRGREVPIPLVGVMVRRGQVLVLVTVVMMVMMVVVSVVQMVQV